MSTPLIPKAYLVSCEEPISQNIESGDHAHVFQITKYSYLVDAKTGTKLIYELADQIDANYFVAPVYDFIQARLSPEAIAWLDTRGIQSHHI
jgi:hypothetical protein